MISTDTVLTYLEQENTYLERGKAETSPSSSSSSSCNSRPLRSLLSQTELQPIASIVAREEPLRVLSALVAYDVSSVT